MTGNYIIPVLVAAIGALATMFAALIGQDRGRKEERLRNRLPRAAEKISQAKPGDRILLPRGFYDETLIIDQPVELVGEGKRSDVVIQCANSSVVTVTGAGARLTNLTIRQQGGQGWHAVDVEGGEVIIDNCEISSESSDCVLIRRDSGVEIRGSIIDRSPGCGVTLLSGARAVVQSSVVRNQAAEGIRSSDGCTIEVRKSLFQFNGSDGIAVGPTENLVEVRSNEFVGNLSNGIAVRGAGSTVTVSDNSINNCGQAGILLAAADSCIVQRNMIKSAGPGIRCENSSAPVVKGNEIASINGDGIVITQGSQGQFEQNEIHDCLLFGILISDASSPSVNRNEIERCERGMGITGNSSGEIESNTIRSSRTDGITVREKSHPSLRSNQVLNNSSDGIYIIGGGQGDFTGNTVAKNSGDGIVVKGSGRPALRHNVVTENGNHGIYIHDGGGATLDHNEVSGNGGESVKVASDCLANVKETGP